MRRDFVLVFGLTFLAVLAACAPASLPTATVLPAATGTPFPTPAPSPSPTSAVDLFPSLPAEFTTIRNADGTWGVGIQVGDETTQISGVSVDAAGLHLTLDSGVVDIPANQILDRIKVGQNSPFQIYNEAGTGIDYAWDSENSVWVEASQVLQPDLSNPENYIKIDSWEGLKELGRLEKMFLLPFPDGTYWPETDKIVLDYKFWDATTDLEAEFNPWYPLGRLTSSDKSPFRIVNYSFLPKGEGRPSDAYIVTEQVYNAADGSFSVLHFCMNSVSTPGEAVNYFKNEVTLSGVYLLPQPSLTKETVSAYYGTKSAVTYLLDNGYLKRDGSMPEIKAWIVQWLTTGLVPKDLENIPHSPILRFFYR
jgi:hypothetical protein